MDVKNLADVPPWEWPSQAHDIVVRTLQDVKAPASDRLLAAQLGGEVVLMDDALAEVLLSVIANGAESEELRGSAAIALGPALEHADTVGFEEDFDDIVLSEPMFGKVKKALHRLFADAELPKEVRRRVFEAAVRAPEEWQRDAIGAAWASDDHEWKLTAVFGMGQMPGFESQILEALNSDDLELRVEAVRAAGNQGVEEGWPVVESVLDSRNPDKDLLLAAIEATSTLQPNEASDLLDRFRRSRDEDIAATAEEAIAMAHAIAEDSFDDEEDEEEDEDEEDEEGDER